MTTLATVIGRGTTAAKPAAADVPIGSLYFDTDLGKLQRSSGAAWEDCAETTGGGAPTDAKYVVTEANGTLTQELVIPGLAGHADRAGAGGAGNSWEFDSGPSPFTWNSAPDSENVGATIPSHFYATDAGTTEHIGHIDWAPAGAFDARCHFVIGTDWNPAAGQSAAAGLIIVNSDLSKRVLLLMTTNLETRSTVINAYTYSGSYTSVSAGWTIPPGPSYLRITRDGSDNFNFYVSHDGKLWVRAFTEKNFAITVHGIGFRIGNAGADISMQIASDWLRTNV